MLQQVVTHTVHTILGVGGFKSRLDLVTVFIVEATQPLFLGRMGGNGRALLTVIPLQFPAWYHTGRNGRLSFLQPTVASWLQSVFVCKDVCSASPFFF